MLLSDAIQAGGDGFVPMHARHLSSLRGDISFAQKFVLERKFAAAADQLGDGV
jgi:hypothetical protein